MLVLFVSEKTRKKLMFLYIFEDGAKGCSAVAPKQGDLQCINDGTLAVVEFFEDQVFEINSDGGRDELPNLEIDDIDDVDYHFIKGD